ncbi:MAG: glycosyltransferase family 4 protein, partial [Lachnospiraceae bacterium]|nr:glycosyltransferase family 4 protein [Lachnospiraceae bacterium]
VKCADEHDWELRLIGPYTVETEDKVADIFNKHPKLKDRIVLTGAINDRDILWQEYKEAKAFLLPSKWESFSIATIEALETGCFLMTSANVPLMADIIEGGNFGVIIDDYSVESWSDAVTKAIKDKTDWDFLCREGYAYVKENYNWDIIADNLYKLIKNRGVL